MGRISTGAQEGQRSHERVSHLLGGFLLAVALPMEPIAVARLVLRAGTALLLLPGFLLFWFGRLHALLRLYGVGFL